MRVRAHAKTHKCPEIGKRQIAAGAVGVCCQKVSEAEAMVEGGIADVLVSNEIVGARKLERLAALARARASASAWTTPTTCASCRRRRSARARRSTSTSSSKSACAAAASRRASRRSRWRKEIAASPNLRFAGLQAYHGRAQHIRSAEERRAVIENAALACQEYESACCEKTGIACPIVTGAGSGTFMFEVELGAWDEIQPGSYVFMDGDYARNEWAAPLPRFEHSLFVLAR